MIHVILTGAGFTANFGAPVSKDIYVALFNKIKNERIRKMFLDTENIKESNYENIYQQILMDGISEKDRKEFIKDLNSIFIDKIDYFCLRSQFLPDNYGDNQKRLLEDLLIRLMNGKNKCIFFTLNQDLFMERQFYTLFQSYNSRSTHLKVKLGELNLPDKDSPVCLQRLPYRSEKEENMTIVENQTSDLKNDHKVKIHYLEALAQEQYQVWNKNTDNSIEKCFYIKLHGSLDFIDDDGNTVLIAGKDKVKDVVRYPLLKKYYAILKEVLKNYDCKIIIIGYSFKDTHINEIIKNSLDKNHEFYIIEKLPLDVFSKDKERLGNGGEKFMQKLRYYSSDGLSISTLKDLITIFKNNES